MNVLLLQHPTNVYGGVHDAPENDTNGGGSEGAEQVFFHAANSFRILKRLQGQKDVCRAIPGCIGLFKQNFLHFGLDTPPTGTLH